MIKCIFGKSEDELSGLNVSRLDPPAPAGSASPKSESPEPEFPSRKPPPRIDDLVLPETLEEEAKHPREVDLRYVFGGSPAATSAASPAELTEAQLEEIARRVADKLGAGVLGDRLHEEVRRVVSETSERLVREEIARIRAEADRE